MEGHFSSALPPLYKSNMRKKFPQSPLPLQDSFKEKWRIQLPPPPFLPLPLIIPWQREGDVDPRYTHTHTHIAAPVPSTPDTHIQT